MTADDEATTCPPRRRAAARVRGALHAGACLGVVLASGSACSNTTLDLFDPDLGLLAHWALDEDQAGASASDDSGFGHPGTPSANPPAPTTNVPPVHFPDPYSLSFNGQDQWLEMGNPELLNLGGTITMAAWIRPGAVDSYRNIVAHGYRWDPNFGLALRVYSGAYQFTYWDGSDHLASAPVPAGDAGTWIHLCGVFDGATYSIYRNGALAAATADGTAPSADVDAVWAIGARAPQAGSGVDYRFAGQIDDVRLYGRALSAAEVQALRRWVSPATGPRPPGRRRGRGG
jgi:hypothetical protein